MHREPLRGGERDGQGFVVTDREEAPGGTVEAHHGARIDRAMAWYRDCLPELALPRGAPPDEAATPRASA